ncbi:adenylate/guanylate cyclase domain-containing protein [Oceanibacterium hippocampi]|uniref:Adenylate cyclase 1 n=1 Tax=Oceanibacterium hippocampi TaxID=745714 RepID=A0A1Y5RWT5_9PROT|nr:adenylate/guanylate cyclase domain-containing protein [Oceanibacterium hippocampi]SLN27448.1 Adenylate cyclase 1 [Oceanibacterium hippocampi]
MAAIGGLVAAAAALVFLMTYHVATLNTTELVRDKAELVIDRIEQRIRGHLEPATAGLGWLKAAIEARDMAPLDDPELPLMLSASLAAAPQISTVAFISDDLQVMRAFSARSGRSVRRDDWSDDPGIRRQVEAARDGLAARWGQFFVAEPVGETFLNLVVPVRRDGRFQGALIAALSIASFSDFLAAPEAGRRGTPFVLRGRDYVLAHPALVRGLAGLSDAHPLPGVAEIGDRALAALWDDDRLTGDENRLANGVTARVVEIDGRPVVFLYKAIADFDVEPWLIGTYLPLDEAAPQLARLRFLPWLGLAIVLAGLVVALLVGGAISRPIGRIAGAARRIRELDLDAVPSIPRTAFRELNEAGRALEEMVRGLRSFAIYVPRQLVRRLMRQGGAIESEPREVTVIFTDIVGFTNLAEDMPAADVAALLNRHFALIADCVEAEEGTIDKYIGDAVMAFWGAPEPVPDHAARACRAVRRIAVALRADNLERTAAGLPPIHVRIGIHSGMVVVGNIGAPTRMNYTVIGDVVNAAERLEMLCRECCGPDADIFALTSAVTAGAAAGAGIASRSLGRRALRGRHGDMEIFALDTD